MRCSAELAMRGLSSGLRRRAYVDEILFALQAYRVPVELVTAGEFAVR